MYSNSSGTLRPNETDAALDQHNGFVLQLTILLQKILVRYDTVITMAFAQKISFARSECVLATIQ